MLSNGQYQLLEERTSFLSSRGLGLPYLRMCCTSRAACEFSENITLGNTATHKRTACKNVFWRAVSAEKRAALRPTRSTNMSSKLWLWGFKQQIWELIYCPATAGKELLPLRESGKPGWRYLEVLDKRMLCTVGLTPEKSELLLLVLPALAELWQYFSSMDCTFSMHVCPSFSGECLSSAEQMPRNTCVSGGKVSGAHV